MRKMFSKNQIENQIKSVVAEEGYTKTPTGYRYLYNVAYLLLNHVEDEYQITQFYFISSVKITAQNYEDLALALENSPFPYITIVCYASYEQSVLTMDLSAEDGNFFLNGGPDSMTLTAVDFLRVDLQTGEIEFVEA